MNDSVWLRANRVGKAGTSCGWFLSLGLVSVPIYLAISPGPASSLLYEAIVLAAALAVIVGTLRNEPDKKAPWVLFAIAMCSFFTGAVLAGIEDASVDATAGAAGLSDLFSLVSYVLLITALIILVRARTARKDQTGLVDALIVVTAAATLTWVFLIGPVAGSSDIGLSSKILAAVYPAMNLTLLAMMLRLAFSAGPKPTSYWLLMAAVLSSLTASETHLITLLNGTYHPGHPLEAGWLLAYLFGGAAALHPTMRELTRPALQRDEQLSRSRIIVFAIVSLIGPLALVIQKARGKNIDSEAVVVGTLVLFFLMLMRAWGLLSHLRRSEQRFRSMIQNSSDATVLLNSSGRIMYVTDSFERILGYNRDDIVGSSAFDLLDAKDVPDALKALRESLTMSGSDVLVEFRVRHRDGRMLWLECHLMNLLGDRSVEGIVGNLRDITERKEKEEQVRAAEESYRRLFDRALEGMYESTLDGRFLKANPAMARILGYGSVDALLADGADVRSHWASLDDREVFVERLQQEGRVSDFEFEAVRKDGERFWVAITTTAVRDEMGRVTHMQGMVKDITARKQAEEATEQLRQSQKMEAVGQLAGGIAHDFNNLLGVIINYSSFVLEDLDGAAPQIHDDVKEIKTAAERGARLVRQLLAFSRKEATRIEPLDVFEVVGYLEKLLTRTIGENIALRVEGEPGLITAADRGHLEQVLMNLVVNARDAMPEGGVITISMCPRRVSGDDAERLGLQVGDYVALTVADTGTGMSAEVAARAFEPFYTTKREGKGTGLGLSLVYGIAKQIGGTIELSTAPERGSRFTLLLPVSDNTVTTGEEPDLLSGGASGSGLIMVCEDEDAVREVVRRILERAGYSVLCARSGGHALELIEASPQAPPRMVLTDIVMPNMSGPELAAEIVKRQPDTRFIFMSGYPDEALGHQGIATLGKNFLEKPFTEAELLELVSATIGA